MGHLIFPPLQRRQALLAIAAHAAKLRETGGFKSCTSGKVSLMTYTLEHNTFTIFQNIHVINCFIRYHIYFST